MKKILFFILLLLAGIACQKNGAAVESIVIKGSDTEVNVALALAEKYMDKEPFVSIVLATAVFRAAGWLSVAILSGIFVMLLFNGAKAFIHLKPVEFFFGVQWNPAAFEKPQFGILPLIFSTILVTFGAMLIAIPLGIATAAYLAEVAPAGVYRFLKPVIELFAGVPSVAVGFIGIAVIAPAIAHIFGLNNGLNALKGSIDRDDDNEFP